MRLNFAELSGDAFAGFLQTRSAIDKGPLGTNLVQLIYQRVSILNGCAYCLAKHAQQLRDAGERPERVDALAGWRASNLYSARERAALAWTDALTDIQTSAASDAEYEALKSHFDAKEIADMTMAITVMNAMNRVAISMRL